MENWWGTFFDSDYIRVWGGCFSPAKTAAEVDGLWQLLQLKEGSRVLDAPCGYGRLSRPLAERGAAVFGVDQSPDLLAHAERERGKLSPARLSYLRHDLRNPLPEGGFDAAINIFSSLGYATEADDLAILRTIASAVRHGALVFVDTAHRDAAVAMIARSLRPAQRLPDGTLVVEEYEFDAVSGRQNATWFWSGPKGSGEKKASLRLYTATELVELMRRAGLRFRSTHRGCSTETFKSEGADMGGRLGILAAREAA